jgi:two-component system NarL family response regulator
MTDPLRIRIMLADDHPVVLQGLSAMIGRQPGMEVVAEARNGREAIDGFRQHHPDVTLMDLRMPEVDGVHAIAILRQEFSTARFIALTTYDTDEEIYRSLKAGAMAYLLKDVPPSELLATIRTVYAGQKHIPPLVATKLCNRMNRTELTLRELEVLRWLAEGHSNRQIGMELGISEGTVRAHVNNILTKLQASDRTQAAMQAIKSGLIRLE